MASRHASFDVQEGVADTAETGASRSLVKVVVAAAVIVAVAIWAGLYFAGGSEGLPTGDSAGVQLAPRSPPVSATPVNPYVERAKQPQPKPDETPTSGGQSWGP